jgi:hypothetical protein
MRRPPGQRKGGAGAWTDRPGARPLAPPGYAGDVRARSRLGLAALALGVALVCDQLVLRLVLADGYVLGRRIAPFDPPVFNPTHQQALARLRSFAATGEPPEASFHLDRELGWCPPKDGRIGAEVYDWAGARVGLRPLERLKVPGTRRLVAIGCSFTEGAEVAGREAWPSLLDEAVDGLEVANLGMGAYGLDQALLRWRRDGRPLDADEVWLGWLPAASLRLVTLYRPAQRHWGLLMAFKPRFELDGVGALQLVPNPARDARDTLRLIEDPDRFLAAVGVHDHWVARWPAAYARTGSRLAHASALGRLLLTLAERRDRDPAAWVRDPDSEVARLVRALVQETRREVEAAGARFRLIVLPGRDDLGSLDAAGRGYWSELVQGLAAEGVSCFDVSPALQRAGGAGADGLWAPNGHYSPEANRVVAEALGALLAQ